MSRISPSPVPRLPDLGTPRSRELLGARPRFEPVGEEVIDRALGVVWQRGTAPRPLHVFEAEWWCEASRVGGHDDWRLPTAVELIALLEPGGAPPALRRRDLFPTPAGATSRARRTGRGWSPSPPASGST